MSDSPLRGWIRTDGLINFFMNENHKDYGFNGFTHTIQRIHGRVVLMDENGKFVGVRTIPPT